MNNWDKQVKGRNCFFWLTTSEVLLDLRLWAWDETMAVRTYGWSSWPHGSQNAGGRCGCSDHNRIQLLRTCLSDPLCKLHLTPVRFPIMPSNYAYISGLIHGWSHHLETQLAQWPSLHLMSFFFFYRGTHHISAIAMSNGKSMTRRWSDGNIWLD